MASKKGVFKRFLVPAALISSILLSSGKARAAGRQGPENIKTGDRIEFKTGKSTQGGFASSKFVESKKLKKLNFNVLFGAGVYIPNQGEISQSARLFVGAEKKFDWNGKKISVGAEAIPEVFDLRGRGVKLGGEYDVGAKLDLPSSGQLKKTSFFINGINLSNEPTEYGRIARLGVKFDVKKSPRAVFYFENNDSGSALKTYFEDKVGKIKKMQIVGRVGASLFEDMSAGPELGVGIKGIKLLGEKGEIFLNYEGGSKTGKNRELMLSFGLRE